MCKVRSAFGQLLSTVPAAFQELRRTAFAASHLFRGTRPSANGPGARAPQPKRLPATGRKETDPKIPQSKLRSSRYWLRQRSRRERQFALQQRRHRREESAVVHGGPEPAQSFQMLRARRSPCGSQNRSPDGRARGGTSAGRATPLQRSRLPRSTPRSRRRRSLHRSRKLTSILSRPSTNTCSGRSGSACTALASAHSEARRMLSRSMRATEATVTATCAVAQILLEQLFALFPRQLLGIVAGLLECASDRG